MNSACDWVRCPLVWLLCAASAATPAFALDLVTNGQPVAVIVATSSEPDVNSAKPRRQKIDETRGSEALAIEILRDWVKKMTGAELAVVSRAEPGQPAVYLGRAAVAAGLKLDDIASPSREGLRIVVEDRRALIGGQNDTATVKGVCRFLEELGCRYLMEGPLGEVYPRTNTLSVRSFSRTEKPGLIYRNPKGPSWGGGYWKLWNGAGGEAIDHAHAWGRYVPKSLFRQHPEWFAMGKDGQRRESEWLCTSNPDLRKFFAGQVIASIKAGSRHPSLSPTDGRGYCQCAACRAQDDPRFIEPSTGVVSVSRRYTDFFDDVARRVGEVCPDSILSFYCYADYTQPPALGRKLSPNLCAVIAPIRYCRLHGIGHTGCASREQQADMIDGWGRLAGRVGYYNYMYNLADALLPFFKFTPCRDEFPWVEDRGLEMMTLEVLSNWHIYGPQIYLSLRLAYAPRADAVAVMDDYWQKFYGPDAGPHMKAYWMGLDQAVDRLGSHAGGFFGLAEIYTPEFLKECETALDRAATAAAGQSPFAERVAMHRQGFQSAVEYQAICAAMNRGDFAGALRQYDRTIARLRGLAAQGYANPEYNTAYLERFLGKHLQTGAAVTRPPARMVQVLPDEWRMTLDEADEGVGRGFPEARFDDSRWKLVRTYSRSLSGQGLRSTTVLWFRSSFSAPKTTGRLALFFTEVDGGVEIYVNGRKQEAVAVSPDGHRGGVLRRRMPFEVDVTQAVEPGPNPLAVRVDNRQISELFLGGILRPVILIERP